jgi:hypothetical protein
MAAVEGDAVLDIVVDQNISVVERLRMLCAFLGLRSPRRALSSDRRCVAFCLFRADCSIDV